MTPEEALKHAWILNSDKNCDKKKWDKEMKNQAIEDNEIEEKIKKMFIDEKRRDSPASVN